MKPQKGFKQFLIKSGIFILTFLAIQLILIVLESGILPEELCFIADVDIGKALLLTAMIFIFLTKDKLKNLKSYNFEILSCGIFGILSLICFSSYNILKSFIVSNPIYATENLVLFYSLKELPLIFGTLFLFLSIFGLSFSKDFFKQFKNKIGICLIVFVSSLTLIIQFQKLWLYFSKTIAYIVNFLLDLTFNSKLFFSGNTPNLGISNFIVNIGKPCSGIDSMMMFIFLFVFIAGYDWIKFNKRKLIPLFFIGTIGVFFVNVLRIYLLITIGAFISPTFAIGFFHSNASMILFLIYFGVFWMFGYKWMRK